MSDITVDPNKIWVLDFETDNLNESNRAFSASPFYEDNRIVNACWASIKIDPSNGNTEENIGVLNISHGICDVPEDVDAMNELPLPWLLCGHNVRFDLQHFRKESKESDELFRSLAEGITLLWDTQFAEYLLSGQSTKMPSLNDLAEKYGFGRKHDEVKEMWDAGYKTRDIDPDVLNRYVEQDVRLTKDIALRQIALAYERELLDFILVQMRSLFVVSEYEWNGMYVDLDRLDEVQEDAEEAKGLYTRYTRSAFKRLMTELGVTEQVGKITDIPRTELDDWFDIDSADKLKRVVFGGEIEIVTYDEDGRYKSGKKKGQKKYKKTTHTFGIPPQVGTSRMPFEYLTPKGREAHTAGRIPSYKEVSLDEPAIRYLLANRMVSGELMRSLLENVLRYRDAAKLEGTYCQQIRDFLFADELIHCNLNVDNTPTGRLTSSNPNMQNQPSKDDSEFKSVFTSRFPNGKIGTVDFKQLEIVGLGYLSGDAQLTSDLLNGRDIHEETGREADVVGPTGMSHDLRRKIKGINFGTIYGAGATKLTQQSGMQKTLVERCVRALKKRYPEAFGREFVESRERELDTNALRLDRDFAGKRRYGNFLTQPTGRKIWIETRSHLDFRTGEPEQTWPYTCLRNYPVQSIAADIVSIARIVFYETIREFGCEEDILMVNEVHDEIVFDMKKETELTFKEIVEVVENRLPEEIERRFGLRRPFDLPLKLEVGIGDSWKTAK